MALHATEVVIRAIVTTAEGHLAGTTAGMTATTDTIIAAMHDLAAHVLVEEEVVTVDLEEEGTTRRIGVLKEGEMIVLEDVVAIDLPDVMVVEMTRMINLQMRFLVGVVDGHAKARRRRTTSVITIIMIMINKQMVKQMQKCKVIKKIEMK